MTTNTDVTLERIAEAMRAGARGADLPLNLTDFDREVYPEAIAHRLGALSAGLLDDLASACVYDSADHRRTWLARLLPMLVAVVAEQVSTAAPSPVDVARWESGPVAG